MLKRRRRVGTGFVLLALLCATSAKAAPGDLDASFGQGGHVYVQANAGCPCVEFGGSNAEAIALQPDGGIVVGGYDENLFSRTPPGSPEPLGALVRLEPNGALDTAFGNRGGIEDTPFAVEQIDTNVHGGLTASGDGGRQGTGVARYTAGGALDGGVRWLPEPVHAGDTRGRTVTFKRVTPFAIDVERHLASGTLDGSFGRGGRVRLRLPRTPKEHRSSPGSLGPPMAYPGALVVQANGGVLLTFAVAAYDPNAPDGYEQARAFLMRLTSAGKEDREFGRKGLVGLPFRAGRLTLRPDGHILLTASESANKSVPTREWLALAEYTPTGHLDRSFGKDGVAKVPLPRGPLFRGASVNAIAFDAAGDSILAGSHDIRTVDTPAGQAFLARFTPHGRDCSFGRRGLAVDTNVTGFNALAVQPNGRIVAAGGGGRFGVARYIGGGAPRTCAGEGPA